MAKKLTKHLPHTYWTKQDNKRALAVYKSTGSIQKTSDVTGIPYSTLELWMRQEWWKEGMLSLKAEDSLQLEDAATNIAKEAANVVRERLANGDHILNKDGDMVRKPVSARDAAIVMGISMQKRKELQAEPIREHELGTAERLLKLVEQFARFANAKEIKGVLAEQREDQQELTKNILEVNDAIESKLQAELQAGSSDGKQGEEGIPAPAERSAEGNDSSREGQTQ